MASSGSGEALINEESLARIAERIVMHPAFQQSIGQLSSNSLSSSSNNTSASSNITTRVVADNTTTPRRRQFSSVNEETSSLFWWRNRGSRGRENTNNTNRNSRGGRRTTRSRSPVIPAAGHYFLKEVILLDHGVDQVVRGGPKKVELIEKGCVFNEVKIQKNLNQLQVVTFFEKLFEKPFGNVHWEENEERFEIKIGVGTSLQKPALREEQELDSYMLHRLFGQKIVWLVPRKDLFVSEEEEYTCERCGTSHYDLQLHQELCQGQCPPLIPDDFIHQSSSQSGNYMSPSNPDMSMPSLNTQENLSTIQELLPDADHNQIRTCLSNANDLDDAVNHIMCANDVAEPSTSKGSLAFTTPMSVLEGYQSGYLLNSNDDCTLSVNRQEIWQHALSFYKRALGEKENLFKKFRVFFYGEDGIDAGALKNEFFTIVFNVAKDELFEPLNKKEWFFIPKRSGGNLQIYKIFGVIVAHSLLQDGPFFNHFAPWVTDMLQHEHASSGGFSVTDIPLTSSTGCLISFIKKLLECNEDVEIQALFSSADGPAYEQIVALSDWNNDVEVTVNNRNILIDIIIQDELVVRRGKKIHAFKEGLATMHFNVYLYIPVVREIFTGVKQNVTLDVVLNICEWKNVNSLSPAESLAQQWFKDYLSQCTENKLVMFLKFATGFENTLSFNGRKISIGYIDENLPHASACSFTFMLPLCNGDDKVKFHRMIDIALNYESVGFGDY